MFLQNTGVLLEGIKQIILKNKKSLLFLSFLILALFPELSFAAETTKDSSQILDIINAFIESAGMVIGLLSQFVGLFLTPEWSSGTAVGFGGNLKTLWVMVSNIVYTIFAFLLIWIAFMNIIGKGGDWELKQSLPKFIGGVLIVPFTWLIVAGMISISNILTVSLLSMPYDTFGDQLNKTAALDKKILCTTYVFGEQKEGGLPISCKKGADHDMSINDLIKKNNGIFGIMTIYTYKIMKIDAQGSLFAGDSGVINTWIQLIQKGFFDIVFFFAFLILLIAIAMALFVRGVYLWIFTIMSPIFGLLFFFGEEKLGELKKLSFTNFLGLVLVPVYVSAALVFGLLFIFVAGENIGDTNCKTGDTSRFCSEYNESTKVSTVKFLGINIEYTSNFGAAGKTVAKGAQALQGSFGELILQIFGLVFLWIALMAALERSDITKAVVAPIKSFGDSVGKLAAAAPTYAPIIPSPSGGMMSAEGLSQGMSSVTSYYTRTKPGKQATEFSKMFGAGGETSTRDINSIKTALATNSPTKISEAMKDVLKNNPNLQTLSSKTNVVDQIIEVAKKIGVSDTYYKNGIKNGNEMAKLLSQMDFNGENKGYNFLKDRKDGTSVNQGDVEGRIYNSTNNSTTNHNITLKNYDDKLKSNDTYEKTKAIQDISDNINSDEVKKFKDVNELSESIKVKMENDSKYNSNLSGNEIEEIAKKVAKNIEKDTNKKFND